MRQVYGTSRGRIHGVSRADRAFLSVIANQGGGVWADAYDLRFVSDGTPCAELPTRAGPPFLQAVAGKQPLFHSSGFVDRGPCLSFNGVSNFMESVYDMSSAARATVFLTMYKDATVNLFEVMVEYATYYATPGANGWTLMTGTTSDRIYTGFGANPGYMDGYVNNEALGSRVSCGVYDAAASLELLYKVNGEDKPLTISGPGMVGNFSAGALSLGARLVSGTPGRFADFLFREILVVPGALSQRQIFELSQHARFKGGLA